MKSEQLKIVVLSGAGISAESGIQTFRGGNVAYGIMSLMKKYAAQ